MKVAIVTGAGRGIGAAVARRLYTDGWSLVVADIDADAIGLLAAELGATRYRPCSTFATPPPGSTQ